MEVNLQIIPEYCHLEAEKKFYLQEKPTSKRLVIAESHSPPLFLV